MDKNTLSDVMNGAAYTFEPCTLHLILFADAATYNKSGNRSQWFVFSALVELPPILRYTEENIIFHSSWSGSNPDFNTYFEKYNGEIDILLKNGLLINKTHYKFKVHLFIADAPARAKGCVCSSFNGKYGCIKCMHPTIYKTKTIYPKLKTVQNFEVIRRNREGEIISRTKPFKELKSINIRSNSMYNEQVLRALQTGNPHLGIKGYSYLSNWIRIPRMVIFDKMHMSDIGTFKTMFNNFFDSVKEDYSLSILIFYILILCSAELCFIFLFHNEKYSLKKYSFVRCFPMGVIRDPNGIKDNFLQLIFSILN